MENNPEVHKRKSIRLKDYDYSQAGYYFVTICTQNREKIFGEVVNGRMKFSEAGMIADKCLNEIQIHFPNSKLDYYCIMPNHLHLIIIINEDVGNTHACSLQFSRDKQLLPVILGSVKSAISKFIHHHYNNTNKVWQKSYYEHIIRNDLELYEIRKYIEINPLNWENDEYYK
jgi:REP element-mobilizing transposase RayT